MKKTHRVVSLMMLTGLLGLSSQGFAATQAFTASVNLAGLGQVTFSAEVRNISNDAAASALGWTGVVLNTTQWKLSDQYVLLNSVITTDGAQLLIYTDNLTATPSYTGTSTSTAAGLVDNTDRTKTLPLAWRVVDTKAQAPTAVNPNAPGGAGFGWFFLTDKSAPAPITPDFAAYRTLANTSGLHMGIGAAGEQFYDPIVSPNFIFIQSNFATAIGRTYSTNKIILESVTQ